CFACCAPFRLTERRGNQPMRIVPKNIAIGCGAENWRSVMPNFDAIVIGTGQSGPALARRLVAAGRKVAIIERKLFARTCVNTGCTPTKTLIASAYAAHVARRAADYGVKISGAVNVDMKAVKARKDSLVAASRNGVERSLKTLEGCTVYEGHGRFVAEKR